MVEIVPVDALKEDVFLHFFSIIFPSTQPVKGESFRAVELVLGPMVISYLFSGSFVSKPERRLLATSDSRAGNFNSSCEGEGSVVNMAP